MTDIVRVIDFETTAIENPEPVEVGWTDVACDPPAIHLTGETHACLIRPEGEITYEAMAVHHITNEEAQLQGVPAGQILPVVFSDKPAAFAAHNAKFDSQMAPKGLRWICTWKCALRIWPEAPSHSNQVLRYWLGLPVDLEPTDLPHRAGPDTRVTAYLLRELLQKHTIGELIGWTERPAILPVCTFGKHKGTPWAQVPPDYLSWILRQDFDEDVVATAKHWQEQHRSGWQGNLF